MTLKLLLLFEIHLVAYGSCYMTNDKNKNMNIYIYIGFWIEQVQKQKLKIDYVCKNNVSCYLRCLSIKKSLSAPPKGKVRYRLGK